MANPEHFNMPVSTPTAKDNTQSLIDIANNTFRELCRTLENEQARLLDLEERRKKLYDEMQRLRAEIEEEKHMYKLNIMESVSENLCNLNKAVETTSIASTLNASNNEESTESIEEFITRQRSKLELINKSLDACLADEGQIDVHDIVQQNDATNNNIQNTTMVVSPNEDNLNKNEQGIDNDEHAKSLQYELKAAMTESNIEKCLNINDSQLELCGDDRKTEESGDDSNSGADNKDRNINNKA